MEGAERKAALFLFDGVKVHCVVNGEQMSGMLDIKGTNSEPIVRVGGRVVDPAKITSLRKQPGVI